MNYETSYRATPSVPAQTEWHRTRRSGRTEWDGAGEHERLRGGNGHRAAAFASREIEEQEPERWDGLA